MCSYHTEHAVPISCPEVLQGPLKFTYDRGLGPCSTIADSRIGSCASTKKLRLVFEQCDEITEYMREGTRQLIALSPWLVSYVVETTPALVWLLMELSCLARPTGIQTMPEGATLHFRIFQTSRFNAWPHGNREEIGCMSNTGLMTTGVW